MYAIHIGLRLALWIRVELHKNKITFRLAKVSGERPVITRQILNVEMIHIAHAYVVIL